MSEQSGAAEACWAHNPEVDGSKPSSAKHVVQQLHPYFLELGHHNINIFLYTIVRFISTYFVL